MFSKNARFNERRADTNLHAYVVDASRYSVRSLQKTNTLQCVLRIMDCFSLFPCHIIFSNRTYPNHVRHGGHFYACAARTEYEINLRGAPYELVPEYFLKSLLVLMTDVISEGSGEHVRLRNLARVSRLTNIKFEVDQIKF